MSFLTLDILALPKSCQRSYSRMGNCYCFSCTGRAPPTSSQPSSKRSSSKSFWKLWSRGNSSNSASKNSSSTTVNESEDSVLHVSEKHLLTILSEIEKLRSERDVEEAVRMTPFSLKSITGRNQKRGFCSSEMDDELEMNVEEIIKILREEERAEQMVLKRRKLVPSSPGKKYREWVEKNGETPGKEMTRWERMRRGVRERIEKMEESGKRKCWRVIGRF